MKIIVTGKALEILKNKKFDLQPIEIKSGIKKTAPNTKLTGKTILEGKK